jgi:hypothetical protein
MVNTRCGQFEEPPDVPARDEMPRRSHHVRAEDFPACQCGINACRRHRSAHAEGERPPGGAVVLRLHGAEPGDNVSGVSRSGPQQAMAPEAFGGDGHLGI